MRTQSQNSYTKITFDGSEITQNWSAGTDELNPKEILVSQTKSFQNTFKFLCVVQMDFIYKSCEGSMVEIEP